ncbi:hypothetical protein B0T21DRAFT_344865 [Apiosordaria backusii]|uniref:Uncharacterized protein n=1 Tax=Apiosordaria backusii TaxID=314023 RepID=A0AA40ESH9_9PEZI|nr:hypothetical protein B0T21DRAFT_344865 [Apiosordaria backusii]
MTSPRRETPSEHRRELAENNEIAGTRPAMNSPNSPRARKRTKPSLLSHPASPTSHSQTQPPDHLNKTLPPSPSITKMLPTANQFNSICDCMIEFHIDQKEYYKEEAKRKWKVVGDAINEPLSTQLRLAADAYEAEELIIYHKGEVKNWKKARL